MKHQFAILLATLTMETVFRQTNANVITFRLATHAIHVLMLFVNTIKHLQCYKAGFKILFQLLVIPNAKEAIAST